MSVGAITAAGLPVISQSSSTSSASGGGFGNVLNQAIDKLNQTQVNANEATQNFLTGNTQDVHQVMVALEEAKISMEMAVEVRNQLVDAYKQVWQMQD